MMSRGSNGSNEHGPLGYFFEGLGVLTNEIRCIGSMQLPTIEDHRPGSGPVARWLPACLLAGSGAGGNAPYGFPLYMGGLGHAQASEKQVWLSVN